MATVAVRVTALPYYLPTDKDACIVNAMANFKYQEVRSQSQFSHGQANTLQSFGLKLDCLVKV